MDPFHQIIFIHVDFWVISGFRQDVVEGLLLSRRRHDPDQRAQDQMRGDNAMLWRSLRGTRPGARVLVCGRATDGKTAEQNFQSIGELRGLGQ